MNSTGDLTVRIHRRTGFSFNTGLCYLAMTASFQHTVPNWLEHIAQAL